MKDDDKEAPQFSIPYINFLVIVIIGVGFFPWRKGFKGRGRARWGEIKFNGSIFPTAKKIVYELHVKRVVDRRLKMGIADETLAVDGEIIYAATDLKTVMTLAI